MISDVFAIIDWSKNRSLPTLVNSLNQDSILLDNQVPQIVINKPEICLGIISQNGNQRAHWHYESRDIILHGNICSESPINDSWKDAEFNYLSNLIFDGAYNLLVWCDLTKSLLITSDYLSIKSLYYWQQDELIVISSTLKAFRLLPFIPQKLNPQVLASTLAISHPFSNDSLIAGVKTFPHNCAAILRSDKIEFLPCARSDSQVNFHDTEAQLIGNLNNLMEQSLETWSGDSSNILLALSGGLDSRILLGYLQRSRRQIMAATWGEPQSDDFELGVALAKANNIGHLTYTFTENSAIAEADLKFPGWQTESFSVNNVPFYWRGWIDLLQTQNLPVIHGFLGGPLGGGRISKWGISSNYLGQEINETVINQLQTWSRNAAPTILQESATAEFKAYLTQGIAQDIIHAFSQIEHPYVYQRLMCLDFYYRQRRYLGNAISKIIGTFLPVMLPFYTKDNLDFVLKLPLELILDRAIFRKLLLEQFLPLASFQEADKGKLPVYANPLKKYFDHLVENRFFWYIFPDSKPRNSALVFELLLKKHSPIFINTIKDSGTILNNYINLEKIINKLESGEINSRNRGEIMRIFNICTFLNYYFN